LLNIQRRVSIPLFSGLHTDLGRYRLAGRSPSQSLCFQGFILTTIRHRDQGGLMVSIPLFSGLHTDGKGDRIGKAGLSQSLCFQGFILTEGAGWARLRTGLNPSVFRASY